MLGAEDLWQPLYELCIKIYSVPRRAHKRIPSILQNAMQFTSIRFGNT